MARNLKLVLVVDLEATCDEGWPVERGEIIELGLAAVVLIEHVIRPIARSSRLLIRPTGSEVTAFCTKLTGITADDLKDAPVLSEAVTMIKRSFGDSLPPFDVKETTWASWGDYDRKQLNRECERKGLNMPLGATHINIKNLYALKHGLEREISVEKAYERQGWKFEGRLHNGSDDAFNIAKLFRSLLE